MQQINDSKSLQMNLYTLLKCSAVCMVILISACGDDETTSNALDAQNATTSMRDMEMIIPSAPDQDIDAAAGEDGSIADAGVLTDEGVLADANVVIEVDADIDTPADAFIAPTECAVDIEVNLPDGTDVNAPVFLAGNFCQQTCDETEDACCDWVPNDPQFTDDQTRRTETLAYFQLNLPAGEGFEYKITQGAWTAVEVEADCVDIPNRILRVACPAGSVYQLTTTVAQWANRCN